MHQIHSVKVLGRIDLSRIDSKAQRPACSDAMDEDERPSLPGDAASRLAKEDLDPYSQDELTARIALLEAEIVRVKAHRDKASAHRAAADALFGGSRT